MNVSDLCAARGIHCTLFATGCIYEYDQSHPMNSGKGFTEEDKPNFDGSFYSKTKAYLEDMLKSYKTTLVLRLRMPISDDLAVRLLSFASALLPRRRSVRPQPRNFVTKIVRYDKVINVPNSMTVLTDMLPVREPPPPQRLSLEQQVSFHSLRRLH
jgi:3,5-epimerase/4-reductase